MMWDRDITDDEFRERLVYSLLKPAVAMARRFRLPMKDMVRWLKIAYFQELRATGMTLQEIGEALEVSLPTAANLSKKLKTNFYRPEREHTLPQRIEFMLWAEDLSRARIQQCLPEFDAARVDAALDQMLADGLIVEREPEGPFQLTRPQGRLVRDSWYARIGSLNSLLENLADTVRGRFVSTDDDAFARTLNFNISRERIKELRAVYEEHIWKTAVRLEEESRDADDRVELKLSLFWAPRDDENETEE